VGKSGHESLALEGLELPANSVLRLLGACGGVGLSALRADYGPFRNSSGSAFRQAPSRNVFPPFLLAAKPPAAGSQSQGCGDFSHLGRLANGAVGA